MDFKRIVDTDKQRQSEKSDLEKLLASIKAMVCTNKCDSKRAASILRKIFLESFAQYCTDVINDLEYVMFINKTPVYISDWIKDNAQTLESVESQKSFQFLHSTGKQVLKHIKKKMIWQIHYYKLFGI